MAFVGWVGWVGWVGMGGVGGFNWWDLDGWLSTRGGFL